MSKSRWVVVDDTSVNIHYSGDSWFSDVGSQDQVGDAGPAYRSTLLGTRSSASLSFSFSGTSVGAFGLSNVRNDSGPSVDETDSGFLCDTGWSLLPDRGVLMTSTMGSVLHFQGTSLSWIGSTYANIPGITAGGTYAVDGGEFQDFDLLDGRVFPAEDNTGQRLFETTALSLGKHDIMAIYNRTSERAPLQLDHLFVQNVTSLLSAGPIQGITPPPTQSMPNPVSSPTRSQDAQGKTTAKKSSATAVIACVVYPKFTSHNPPRFLPFPSIKPPIPLLSHRYSFGKVCFGDDQASSPTPTRPPSFVPSTAPPSFVSEGVVDHPHWDKTRSVHETTPPHRVSSVPSTAPPSFMSEPMTSRNQGPVSVLEAIPYDEVLASQQTQLQPSVEELSPRVVRHEDSGIRGSNIGPLLELPPVYTLG
ncbi:hypothetical protein CPB83DRAFT_899686 [Crepidotus variabilis]|uniref:Uncharacterized protein n=1 Tax=Crepidotus variabilis TaxID=179855 RepID=A0A9P6E4K3_9AGAR|nr:hypothetical protein CPB83DRAFT_899686 [Crepidotus variabilis]